MKVLLIHPPSKRLYQGYLPLGLAYIAGVLLRAGHDITVWDLDVEGWSRPEVLKRMEEEGECYDLVGISALASEYPYVKWISNSWRRMNPDGKIVLGGSLASALPGFLMEELPLDFAVVGEGEETIVELAGALSNGSDPALVRGIYYRDDSGKIIATPPRPRQQVLDRLPTPAWELFPMEKYLRAGRPDDQGNSDHVGAGAVSIMASRGCPFHCNYCDHTVKGYKPRYRSVDSVIQEIKMLLERYGEKIEIFYFWDDILIWDREWVLEFCEALRLEGLNIRWSCNGHVSRVDPGLMFRMKEAGCVGVRFGIESGSQKILDALDKGVKVEDALKALKICLDAGLGLTIYTMVGMRGECRATIDETVEFLGTFLQPLYSPQIISINYFMLTPFPGTRLFKSVARDWSRADIADFLERDCDAYNNIPVNISGQTDGTMIRLKKELEDRVTQMRQDAKNRLQMLLADMAREWTR